MDLTEHYVKLIGSIKWCGFVETIELTLIYVVGDLLENPSHFFNNKYESVYFFVKYSFGYTDYKHNLCNHPSGMTNGGHNKGLQ